MTLWGMGGIYSIVFTYTVPNERVSGPASSAHVCVVGN